ncbi:MAG: hypothetical protein ABSG32_11265 [Terriglobia bacterium]
MLSLLAGFSPVAEKRSQAVILSVAKDLALRIFMNNARFFVACGV